MSESSLSFASTSSFRNSLLARNLAPYNVEGVWTPPVNNISYEITLTDSSVIDSPNNLIADDPFANQLYPLNEFGPEGGFDTTITYNGPPLPVNSNQGPYNPNQTALDLINEFNIDAQYIENKYGPNGGFQDMFFLDTVQVNNKIYSPYWQPPSFLPSNYTPYEILTSENPDGNNGPLSQDSFIARIGAESLRFAFGQRIGAEIFQNTVGQVNLESLQDPFEISLLVTGQQPLVYRNWRITVPENPILRTVDLITRLSSAYWPVSPIPGDYFDDNSGVQNQQTSLALNTINQLTGGFLGPILNINRNPSEIFLANTGNGQRSVLFSNIDYNRYQPPYDRNFGGILGIASGIVNLAIEIINPDNGTLIGGYYVGNKTSEPSSITSPPNQVPVNVFGQQVKSPVYGPSELGILFEGNQENLNFTFTQVPYSNGGSLDGGFTWVSPKFQDNAGYHVGPGGAIGSIDEDFNLVSSNYTRGQSTNLTFKGNSILDNTQRLVESADNVQGTSRLKHVGNAINQVSKVFNDGYKEITKGSKVLSYVDNTTGDENGIEYCRIFTKDTPYLVYRDLQKVDGITTQGRRFSHSVLDSTFNLNISPTKNPGSTNIIADDAKTGTGGYAKKYMFSLENLAWRTSSRPGYTYDDLPTCEKGPNGGRVMWFPPYELTYSDSSTANWQPTSFLGRPEPIYTYKDTNRTGNLSWKIIVDSPSVLNVIVEQQLKGKSSEKINSILDSFFAGCVKFDIYELAKKYNTIPTSDLYTYQEILNKPNLTKEEYEEIVLEIPSEPNTDGSAGSGTEPTPNLGTESGGGVNNSSLIDSFKTTYEDLGFYFFNDIPDPNTNKVISSVSYQDTYDSYTNQNFIDSSIITSNNTFNINEGFCKNNVEFCENQKQINDFYNTVIIPSYKKASSDDKNFIDEAYEILSNGLAKISIEMVGSASATATVNYNKNLSVRRIDSVEKFFKTFDNGKLLPFFEDGSFKIVNKAAKGEIETIAIPKMADGSTGREVNCNTDISGSDGVTSNSQIYAVDAMACRRVKISKINIESLIQTPTPTIELIEQETIPNPDVPEITTIKIPLKTPTPKSTKTIVQKLKENLGKRILRNLLTECDYFEVIKENVPFVYDSIREKIRYFNPAFHSMTPEGLNSRLTFLNQCLRPGETIPIIGSDGKPRINDSINTSFGAPPVLVLRIGDFFNTKIIPKNLQFQYENFDLNPEGIGIQPMIAKVTLSFDIIGGMGIAKPVEELQNALSFNYYANTEIYDERATSTEDTTAIDKELAQLLGLTPEITTNISNTGFSPQQQNEGGSIIGEIITTVPIEGGSSGETSYQKIMDNLLLSSKSYFETIPNKLQEINDKYNYGIVQMINQDRYYINGDVKSNGDSVPCKIYGVPYQIEQSVKNLFDKVIEDIENDTNPIMDKLVNDFNFFESDLRQVRINMVNYVKELQNVMNNDLTLIIQDMSSFQQTFVRFIQKLNIIDNLTDGKINSVGTANVYTLSGLDGDNVSQSSSKVSNTYEEFYSDYFDFGQTIDEFYDFCVNQNIITSAYTSVGDIFLLGDYFTDDITYKSFYMIIGRILSNSNTKENFISSIISDTLTSVDEPYNLQNKFKNITNDLARDYKKEVEKGDDLFKDFKGDNNYIEYKDGLDVKMFPAGKTRKFSYTTVGGTEQQKTEIQNLYKSENTNNDTSTYLGKVKFNN